VFGTSLVSIGKCRLKRTSNLTNVSRSQNYHLYFTSSIETFLAPLDDGFARDPEVGPMERSVDIFLTMTLRNNTRSVTHLLAHAMAKYKLCQEKAKEHFENARVN